MPQLEAPLHGQPVDAEARVQMHCNQQQRVDRPHPLANDAVRRRIGPDIGRMRYHTDQMYRAKKEQRESRPRLQPPKHGVFVAEPCHVAFERVVLGIFCRKFAQRQHGMDHEYRENDTSGNGDKNGIVGTEQITPFHET